MLVADVKSGVISEPRLDDAVRRILRVKLRMGVFDEPSPAHRSGTFKPIGTLQHRAVAREAVRKSLVLLKNNRVLPIKPNATVLVAGEGANKIRQPARGRALRRDGGANRPNDVPRASSHLEELEEHI